MYEYPIVGRLVHPYAPLVMVLGVVIARLWWKGVFSRAQRLGITIPFLLLLTISLPAVSYLAFASLECFYPPMDHRAAHVEAIVILGGYASQPNARRDYAILGPDTLARCLHGAALFHQAAPCWMIVSGGKIDSSQSGPTLAEAMRDFLVSQGIPEKYILLEDRSGNTYENAVELARLLKNRRFEEVILVTDAASLLRADLCFRRQGMKVTASGCRYRTVNSFPFSVMAFLPSVDAADDVSEVWHEWLGLFWYWLRNRI